jgi:pyruvate/2-oxoglutarate dehydrogenase complex dihydrolipoamide dehydrogenase (E3) component
MRRKVPCAEASARTAHAHPTPAEALREAARAVAKRSIHS